MGALVISIDLDSPSEYAGIHGVRLATEDPHLMYRGPLRRYAELCRAVGGVGTVFAIARDICGVATEKLRELRDAGFEIACHSNDHDYRLSQLPPGQILRDLRLALAVFERELGIAPVGFRAPGYNLSSALLDELERHRFVYDSSVLPSPPYFAAKLGVLGLYWLAARRSASILGSPRAGFAPRAPYRPGADPYRRGSRQIVELPLAVATRARLPVTGASLVLAPPALRTLMLRSLRKQEVVVVNLHGMDLVDPVVDGLPEVLRGRQPELRLSAEERDGILRGALATLAAGREVTTCAAVAAGLAAKT